MERGQGGAGTALNRRLGLGAGLGVLALLGGCAAVPDVTLSYRHVDWAIDASLVLTLSCDPGEDQPRAVAGGLFASRYFAHAERRETLRLDDVAAFYADSDLAMAFTDDGRLKSINAANTGQAAPILTSLVGTVAALGAATAGRAAPQQSTMFRATQQGADQRPPPPQPPTACDVVRNRSADETPTKSVSITYRADALGHAKIAEPDPRGLLMKPLRGTSELLHKELAQASGELESRVYASYRPGSSEADVLDGRVKVAQPLDRQRFVPLRLQRTGVVRAQIVWVKAPPYPGLDSTKPIRVAEEIVPLAETFELPVPRPALFGKQSFSLSLAESGRVASVGWGATAGLAAALDAASTLATAEQRQQKAELDRLVTEQNLAKAQRCADDPNKC